MPRILCVSESPSQASNQTDAGAFNTQQDACEGDQTRLARSSLGSARHFTIGSVCLRMAIGVDTSVTGPPRKPNASKRIAAKRAQPGLDCVAHAEGQQVDQDTSIDWID